MECTSIGDDGDRKRLKGSQSSSAEEADHGGNTGGSSLKKGPWTAAEDAILLEYVQTHGEGNWNAVQKNSGLARCGKSCRLRWANHLRPDLKKGSFTAEEEHKIIELHAKFGNKWAQMASELPGRTDNEIKNYWNTRIKRQQRAHLPIYPDDIVQQLNNSNNQEKLNDDSLTNEANQHDGMSQTEDLDIPDLEFRNYFPYQCMQLEPPTFHMRESALFGQSTDPSHFSATLLPTVRPSKRPRESDMIYDILDSIPVPTIDHDLFGNLTCDNIAEYSSLFSPCNPILSTSSQFYGGDVTGSHATPNGNNSASEALLSRAMKLELPSLQYFATQQGSWDTQVSPVPSLPSLETSDTLIQSPPIESFLSDISPESSGLLAMFFSNSMSSKCANVEPLKEKTDPCVSNEAVNSSTLNTTSTQWDEQEELNSALCYESVAPLLTDFADTSMNSLDGLLSVENVNHFPAHSSRNENLSQIALTHPDALRDSISNSTWHDTDQYILNDALSALHGKDSKK